MMVLRRRQPCLDLSQRCDMGCDFLLVGIVIAHRYALILFGLSNYCYETCHFVTGNVDKLLHFTCEIRCIVDVGNTL